jgi:hypothetical protein
MLEAAKGGETRSFFAGMRSTPGDRGMGHVVSPASARKRGDEKKWRLETSIPAFAAKV